MADSLAGRRLMVVGAARGIGREACRAFVGAGAAVAAFDLRADALGDLPVTHEGALDVRDEAAIAAAVDASEAALGGLDGLFYAAAAPNPRGAVDAIDPAVWNDDMAVNLTGAFLTARAAIPALRRAGGGDLVFVASQLGSVAVAGGATYCVAKAALIQFARVLALDHGAENIRANTLSPGPTWTERLADRFGARGAAEQTLGTRTALGRLGTAEEIAAAAVFLFGPGARYMSGSDLVVDGGYLAS